MTMEKPLKQMLHVAMKNNPSNTGFRVSSIAVMKLKYNIGTEHLLTLLSPLTSQK
jgi:hypothetical protein